MLQELLQDGKLTLGTVQHKWSVLVPRVPSFLETKFSIANKYTGKKFQTAVFNELERFCENIEKDKGAVRDFFVEVVKGSKSALPLPAAPAPAALPLPAAPAPAAS